MPRGVKGSGKAAAKARAPAAPKPPATPVAQVQPEQRPSSPLAPRSEPPLASVDVDSLAGEALRKYAIRAGVPKRDVDNLTEDRLRTNVKLTIARTFDLITDEA